MLTEENLGQEVDAFLEHFGKKGMRWGVRTKRPGAFATSKHKHQLNKASRQKDAAKIDKTIDRARGRVASGKTKAEFKKAKSEHAANKAKLGSREARKILNKARQKKYTDVTNSQAAKSGRETTVALLVTAGFLGLAGLSMARDARG